MDDDPNSLMRQWRHDDEEVAYPTFELIQKSYARLKGKKPGFNNICVHKGLAPGPPDPSAATRTTCPRRRDWPRLNFITYHACIQPNFFLADTLEEVKADDFRGGLPGVPDIRWTTEYAQLARPAELLRRDRHDLGVVGGDVPDDRAHIMGQLMKFMGEDRIVFGSDSVWYGSPQWQIEALWRFQIPEALRENTATRSSPSEAKRKILGLNSARLYKVPVGGEHEHEHERERGFGGDD